ncbi:mariner Mos1 transposase [Trichonephila clavipes]|nr:mariner Mos1 transposase [Trichonephila clavipes]
MLSKGVFLLHNNARPRTCRTTRELTESFDREVLNHAPYSPNPSPSDFHLFRYLKHSIGRKRFSDNEKVKADVNSWLSDKAADFFEEGFYLLVLRYDKCINKLGNYAAK